MYCVRQLATCIMATYRPFLRRKMLAITTYITIILIVIVVIRVHLRPQTPYRALQCNYYYVTLGGRKIQLPRWLFEQDGQTFFYDQE